MIPTKQLYSALLATLLLSFCSLISNGQDSDHCVRNKEWAVRDEQYIKLCDSFLIDIDSTEMDVYKIWVKHNRVDSVYSDSVFKELSKQKTFIKQFKEEREFAIQLLWIDSAFCPDKYWGELSKTFKATK